MINLVNKKVKLKNGDVTVLGNYPYTRDFLYNDIKEIIDQVEYENKKLNTGDVYELLSGEIGIIQSLHYDHFISTSRAKIPYHQVVTVKNAKM